VTERQDGVRAQSDQLAPTFDVAHRDLCARRDADHLRGGGVWFEVFGAVDDVPWVCVWASDGDSYALVEDAPVDVEALIRLVGVN
jgi:hypothetical protein